MAVGFRIACAMVGLTVLIPAFILFFHFSALSNASIGNELLVAFLWWFNVFFNLIYLLALWRITVRVKKDCLWCYIWSFGFAAYVVIGYGYIISGNFARKVELSGLGYAIEQHIQDFIYLLFPLLLIVMLLLALRRKA